MTIIRKTVKAGALPADWRTAFPDPDSTVLVEIREIDGRLDAARTLEEVMDIISTRAEERGLTPDVLRDILNER